MPKENLPISSVLLKMGARLNAFRERRNTTFCADSPKMCPEAPIAQLLERLPNPPPPRFVST
jgi:hypothetical protein